MRIPDPVVVRQFQRRLLNWFDRNGRRFPWRTQGASLYEKVISEFLLQRTRAEVVARFVPAFLAQYPNWTSLARARPDDLRGLLRPLGLWRRRAASMISLAIAMRDRRGRFPRGRQQVEALPGVGQYIANAVLLFSEKQAEPLLDVNMARVLERCFGRRTLVDIRYDSKLQTVSRLVIAGSRPAEVNWAVLDLAALVCRHEPECPRCPLNQICPVGRQEARQSVLLAPGPRRRMDTDRVRRRTSRG